MLAQRQRWMILGGALVLTLILIAGTDKSEPEPVTLVGAASRTSARKAAPELQVGSIASLERGMSGERVKDLFPQQTWYVPPPPPKPVPPAPPPLPFSYLGKVVDGGQVTVFVAQGERNLVVKQGDVIDGIYRVENIAPPAMTFTYLPLRMQQTLEIGVAN